MSCKKAFTLIELLVTISIIALLMGILLPTLSRAREQAKIVVVNAELHNIGLALESYGMDNIDKFPPTRADCNPSARKHVYALPQELVDSGYLPKGELGKVRFARIDDRYNRGCAYKYIAAGPVYDYHGTPFGNQHLYIPEGFPDSPNTNLIKYDNPNTSPVKWVIFSLGPRYDIKSLERKSFPIHKGFPIKKIFWYSPKTRKGLITRIRLNKGGIHVGSFEGS